MPTYDFECKECKHRQEEVHSMTEEIGEVVCEKCGGVSVQIITKVSFITTETNIESLMDATEDV